MEKAFPDPDRLMHCLTRCDKYPCFPMLSRRLPILSILGKYVYSTCCLMFSMLSSGRQLKFCRDGAKWNQRTHFMLLKWTFCINLSKPLPKWDFIWKALQEWGIRGYLKRITMLILMCHQWVSNLLELSGRQYTTTCSSRITTLHTQQIPVVAYVIWNINTQ